MNIIIFDMDGTLINSGKAITVTINEMREVVGLESNLAEDFIVKVINDPDANYVDEFYPNIKVTKEISDEFEVKFKKNYALYAKPYDGVKELLESLKKEDFYIALASNAPQDSLKDILIKSEIYTYFDDIIGARTDIPKKPDPKMLFEILKNASKKESLQNEKYKALFVGDSYKDMLASKNANIPYLQVLWGFGSVIEGEKNIATISQAYKYILNLFYRK